MLNCWPIIGSACIGILPAWSISIEWFCYVLLFPLLLFQKPPQSPPIRMSCMIVLPALSYYLFVSYFDASLFNPELHVAKSPLSYWVNLCRGIFGFATGWIVFASFEKRDGIYAFCTKYSTVIWSGIVFALFLRYCELLNRRRWCSSFHSWCFTRRVLPQSRRACWDQSCCTFSVLISYSIYMMHLIVLVVFVGVLHAVDTWQMTIFRSRNGISCLDRHLFCDRGSGPQRHTGRWAHAPTPIMP